MMTGHGVGFWYVANYWGAVQAETEHGPFAYHTPLQAIVRAQDLADSSGIPHTVFMAGGSLDHEVSVLPSAGRF